MCRLLTELNSDFLSNFRPISFSISLFTQIFSSHSDVSTCMSLLIRTNTHTHTVRWQIVRIHRVFSMHLSLSLRFSGTFFRMCVCVSVCIHHTQWLVVKPLVYFAHVVISFSLSLTHYLFLLAYVSICFCLVSFRFV